MTLGAVFCWIRMRSEDSKVMCAEMKTGCAAVKFSHILLTCYDALCHTISHSVRAESALLNYL